MISNKANEKSKESKIEMSENNTILFVEDTADTRDLVEFGLRHEGLDVTTAQTAEEGAGIARQREFALILLDVGLPDKDGLELCREIRGFNKHTPILFFTAFADLLDHEEAKRAGAQGCLRKPEDTSRLAPIIKALIAKRTPETSTADKENYAASPD